MTRYIFKIKLRGMELTCHASSWDDAVKQFSDQWGEPIGEYGLEWSLRNLDGTVPDYATYERIFLGGSGKST